MRATNEPSSSDPTAIGRIYQEERVLLLLRARFLALRAFEHAVEELTRGKPFHIWNDVVWTTLLDSRDALFIHFASWARSLCEGGRFFSQLKAHHLREFYVKRPKPRRQDDVVLRDTQHHRRGAMESRFPAAAAQGKVVPDDIDAVKDAFYTTTKPVIDDRDVHRAHPFEKGERGNVSMLRLDEFEAVLETSQDLLNDLRLICDDSTLDYHDHLSLADAEATSRDLADLVLFGTHRQLHLFWGFDNATRGHSGQWTWQCREAFYDELHAAHDAGSGEALFNAHDLIDRVRPELAG